MDGSRTLRRRRRRGAAVAVACALAAAVAARRAGLPDPACGAFLTSSATAVLCWLAVVTVRRDRLGLREATAWALGLAVAAAGPVFTAVWPGEEIATGRLADSGDELRLQADHPARVLLLVSAALSEPGQVAFELRAGNEVVPGELYRGARRWSVGDERGHTHLDRASLVVPVQLPAGEARVALERSSSPGLVLTLKAYRAWLPGWLPAAFGICALLAFAWRCARLGGGREAVMATSAAILAGLAAGAVATPAHAMGAAVRGLVVGGLVGLPVGAGLAAAAVAYSATPLAARRAIRSRTPPKRR